MLRLHALAYVCDPTPISAFLFPLLSGVQLKITANFCKWRWRRLKCCMHCMRRHGEGCVSVYVRECRTMTFWLCPDPDPHLHPPTSPPPHTHTFIKGHNDGRRYSRCTDFCWQWVWKLKASDCICPLPTCQPPNSTHKAQQKGLQNFCLSPWPGLLEV